jgi:predicted nucleic-acid-binding protein
MIAVDTNVIVRFLVGDDAGQAASAKSLLARQRIALAHTVLLETDWVLRRGYRFARGEVSAALRRLLGMGTVFCARRDAVLNALRAVEQGCDFADALHACAADHPVSVFVTFDRDFVAQAGQIGGLPPVRLLGAGEQGLEPV